MKTEWYCTVQGNISGPHTASEVRARAGRGDLPPDSLLRRGKDGRWVRADSVNGLKFAAAPSPSVFRVKGPDRQSGRLRELVITAASLDQAQLLAAEGGILTGTAHDAVVAAQQAQRQAELPAVRPPQLPHVPPDTAAKYPALAALAGWYRFLAMMSGLAAVFGAMYGGILASQSNGNAGPGIVIVGGSALWGVLSVVSLLAFAEGIALMRDVEFTLREIRDRLPSGGRRPEA